MAATAGEKKPPSTAGLSHAAVPTTLEQKHWQKADITLKQSSLQIYKYKFLMLFYFPSLSESETFAPDNHKSLSSFWTRQQLKDITLMRSLLSTAIKFKKA